MEERKFKEHEEFDEKDFEKESFSESNSSPMKTGSGRLKTSSSRQEGVKQEASSKYKQQVRRRMRSESRSDASASDQKATLNANSSYQGSRALGKELRKTSLRFVEEGATLTHRLASKSHQSDDDSDASEQAVSEAQGRIVRTRLRSHSLHGIKPTGAKSTSAAAPQFASASTPAEKKTANSATKVARSRAKKDLMRAHTLKGASANAAFPKGITTAGSPALNAASKVRDAATKWFVSFRNGAAAKTVAIAAGLMLIVSLAVGTVFMPVAGSLTQTSVASSYATEDKDIKAVDAAYSALESQVESETTDVESRYPGYDEYRYRIDEIGHNPYSLAALLTARYGEYDLPKAKDFLNQIAAAQYVLTYTPSTETREREAYDENGNPVRDATGNPIKETYTVRIMTVSLSNTSITGAAAKLLTDEEIPHYQLLVATKGNRDDLFQGAWTANPSTGGFGYTIPAEALKDSQFAAMIKEAEKYLGYPYVWGGSSPATSFDCSGFVCWVINHSVGNVGRTTAEGLRGYCSYVSPSEAKPGDIIFFQNTYPEVGASHVGIYVGNGMMIHCGDPIQYASIETSYWQQHFLAFGRLH